MKQEKILAGSSFPTIAVEGLDGRRTEDIGKPTGGAEWKMVVVYRGRHCPLCTKYLNKLDAYKEPLREIGIDLEAVSGDSEAQLRSHLQKLDVSYPLYYGLSIEQMQKLGLYISYPRSEKETDHPFAEPGLFVVNAEGNVQVVDISNNPFVRPDIEQMYSGLEWIRNNDYPIRGTYP
jgi:peroxiredoxin